MAEERDVTNELSGLRREVFEMRNLVIKTDNLLKTFHAELKEVAKKQALSEQRHHVRHVAAYVTIAVLALGGALLYGGAAGSAARHEAAGLLDDAHHKLAQAQEAEKAARDRLAAADRADADALAAWKLITSGEPAKQDEGLTKAARLDTSRLSAFARAALDNAGAATRERRAEEAFNAGMLEQRRGNPRGAKEALDRFLTLAEQMPPSWKQTERLQATYHLGALCNQLGDHERAIPLLRQYLQSGESASAKAYAYLLLGDSLEATKNSSEARDAYRAGLTLSPGGVTGGLLRRRLGEEAG